MVLVVCLYGSMRAVIPQPPSNGVSNAAAASVRGTVSIFFRACRAFACGICGCPSGLSDRSRLRSICHYSEPIADRLLLRKSRCNSRADVAQSDDCGTLHGFLLVALELRLAVARDGPAMHD